MFLCTTISEGRNTPYWAKTGTAFVSLLSQPWHAIEALDFSAFTHWRIKLRSSMKSRCY